MTGARRLWAVLRLSGTLVVFLAMVGPWLLLPRRGRARRALARMAWRWLLAGIGLRVVVHGQPIDRDGALYVANHISWTDIPVLGRVLDAGFVAKGEIRDWPVIGRLTQAYGCLFVERERRGRAQEQAQALASHLVDRRALVLFPEGTTGLGDGVLSFRSSLFAMVPGVSDGVARVQPVCLTYRHRDGTPLSPAQQRQVAWIGDDALLPHALALAALADSGGLLAEIWFEDAVTGADRKALARQCEAAIARRLAGPD